MTTSSPIVALLNLAGFAAATALYATLLVMVLRARKPATTGRRSLAGWLAVDRLALITACLGLLWNVGTVGMYGLPAFGVSAPGSLLVAVAFTALGFLPAVVVHSVLRGAAPMDRRAVLVTVTAYALSALAGVLHFAELATGAPPSATALGGLTVAFGILVVPWVLLLRRQPGWRRALWVVALSVFAVSALHLSHHNGGDERVVEILGHHASLPLALAILYQEYPFAVADLFLKRALTLLALIALAFGGYVLLALPLAPTGAAGALDLRVAVLLGLWVATALIYPAVRRQIHWFVDAVVLGRADYAELRAEISRVAPQFQTVESLLDGICERLRPALSARQMDWAALPLPPEPDMAPAQGVPRDSAPPSAFDGGMPVPDGSIVRASSSGTSATVLVPTAEPPWYAIRIDGFIGGRRLLSDDLTMLDAVATILGRRIDTLRIAHERCDQRIREEEISKLASEADLRALRAQINPHFLFNALTTIGYLIQTGPDRALDTLMRLTELLRRVLRSEGELTTLENELNLIESYLEIERARFEERLQVTIAVPPELRNARVPPLVLQPLVENAIKHGIAPLRDGGQVTVSACLVEPAESNRASGTLRLIVSDSGAGANERALARGRAQGVGISNVERRLERSFGAAASLQIRSVPGAGTVAELRLPLSIATEADAVRQAVAAEQR